MVHLMKVGFDGMDTQDYIVYEAGIGQNENMGIWNNYIGCLGWLWRVNSGLYKLGALKHKITEVRDFVPSVSGKAFYVNPMKKFLRL